MKGEMKQMLSLSRLEALDMSDILRLKNLFDHVTRQNELTGGRTPELGLDAHEFASAFSEARDPAPRPGHPPRSCTALRPPPSTPPPTQAQPPIFGRCGRSCRTRRCSHSSRRSTPTPTGSSRGTSSCRSWSSHLSSRSACGRMRSDTARTSSTPRLPRRPPPPRYATPCPCRGARAAPSSPLVPPSPSRLPPLTARRAPLRAQAAAHVGQAALPLHLA